MKKQLILAGGGHGHIMIIKELAKAGLEDYEITLISDFKRQYYSGMLPAYLEGIYSEEEISFEILALCKSAGINFVLDKIIEIDGEDKTVTCKNHTFTYDFISMNLGSSPIRSMGNLPPNAIYAKPIAELVKASPRIADPKMKDIAIIGAGASGVELALSLSASYPEKSFTLIGSKELIRHFNDKTRAKVLKVFEEREVKYIFDHVDKIDENILYLTDKELDYDFAIFAGGVTGPEISWKGFQVNEKNQVIVDSYLRASSSAIAMGDMIQLADHPNVPMAGVFAIRQAPILKHNLLTLCKSSCSCDTKSALNCYCPQSKYLAILNIGNKKAILNRGSWSWQGHIPWLIKDWIDRAYMEK